MVKVTVATVALNAADDLPLTLESVLAQDHDDLELLVVDGASWDDTPGVLTRYGDAIDRVEVVEDGGIYVAMNHAASVASGEFVLFMNAGDRFHTERSLSKLLARTRPDADVVWGNHVWRDGAVEVFRIAMDPGTLLGELRIGAVGPRWIARFPAHQATLTRTALLRSLRYDTVWRLAADHDLLLRALHGGAVGQYVDEVVAIYASGGLSHHRAALCRLEWNAIYRAFSERPKAVDAAFYPHGSPFAGTPSPLAGGVVGGLVVEPGATAPPAEAWVGAAGLTLRTPTHALAREVRLHGRNDAPGQHLDLAAGGRSLGDAALAQGPFDLVVEFDPPLGPGTLLEAVPREVMRHPDRAEIVAFVLSGVAFASGGAPAPLPLRVPMNVQLRRARGGRDPPVARLVAARAAPRVDARALRRALACL
ncbi:glycosyltransferase [Acuticoccus sp.]|uniref:glycosyltransferase n=1 Tax=Acuticoccus sp. TaxID=1904378 RepID=UPI003B515550